MTAGEVRALVIDDSKIVRMIVCRMLESLAFATDQAENGRAALGRLDPSAPPDLILVDWHMPEMSGLEFVRVVRDIPAYARIPLVMVASEDEEIRVARALGAAADEYVVMPFTRDVIAGKLDRLGFPVGARRVV